MEPEALIGRCPEGQEFVRGYRKRNGEYVSGFCRKRHKRTTKHDRQVDRMNLRVAREVKEEEPQEAMAQEPQSKQELKQERKEEKIESTIRQAEEHREQ